MNLDKPLVIVIKLLAGKCHATNILVGDLGVVSNINALLYEALEQDFRVISAFSSNFVLTMS